MFVEEIQFVTLSVFDLAISSIFMTARHSAPLICSTSELNFAILIFQCSSSAIGPVSSASFRICSLSANTCETKILHFHCYMCIKLWNRRRVEFILGPRELQTQHFPWFPNSFLLPGEQRLQKNSQSLNHADSSRPKRPLSTNHCLGLLDKMRQGKRNDCFVWILFSEKRCFVYVSRLRGMRELWRILYAWMSLTSPH